MFLTKLSGQPEALHRADSLFKEEAFFEASIAYERTIYLQPESKVVHRARYKKAVAYRHLHRYEDALRELDRLPLFSIADTLKSRILYETAFNHLLQDKPEEALWKFRRLEKTREEPLHFSMIPLKILILNHNRKWEEAKGTLLSLVDSMPLRPPKKQSWRDSIKSLYDKDSLPKNYSEEKAKNLSRFIPGAGHIYTGYPWEGAASFLLNGAAIGFGIHQLWYKYYFTAYITGFGIFYKSYFGGMKRAAHLAEIARHNEMKQFNDKCSALIMKILR